MKPHPRIRKTIKWGGAVVTVLLVVVWVGSGRMSLYWMNGRGFMANVNRGLIQLHYPAGGFIGSVLQASPRASNLPPALEPMWAKEVHEWDLLCWVQWHDGQYRNGRGIPIWIAVLGALSLTSIAWRLDTLARRRTRLNLCPKCNYDRTGLVGGAVCPECGRLPT